MQIPRSMVDATRAAAQTWDKVAVAGKLAGIALLATDAFVAAGALAYQHTPSALTPWIFSNLSVFGVLTAAAAAGASVAVANRRARTLDWRANNPLPA